MCAKRRECLEKSVGGEREREPWSDDAAFSTTCAVDKITELTVCSDEASIQLFFLLSPSFWTINIAHS